MELKDMTGKPCSSKVSYEFFPKKKTIIDLEKARSEISAIGDVEVASKVLLIVKIGEKTVSIFKDGKLLVRGEKDELKAREVAQKLCIAMKESAKEKKGLFG